MNRQDARKRVAAGAALLDRRYPGWARRIHTGRLDMGDACACILGQLEDDFWSAIAKLWPERQAIRGAVLNLVESQQMIAIRHGFNTSSANEDDWSATDDAEFQWLQEAWIEAIADRVVGPVEWTHRLGEAIQASTGRDSIPANTE